MAQRYLNQISEIVKKIQHDGDPITYSKQTQYVGQFLLESCQTDHDIQTVFQDLNNLALDSEDVAINLPHVLTSRYITETVQFPNTTVRNEALRILQGNFAKHQAYKTDRPEKAYNALTLLGEFYNLLRVAEQPISILGQSLLQLLGQELQEVLQGKSVLRAALAKLVLTQFTLNGQLLKKYELAKLNPLLDTMRRVIVEADAKSRCEKAYLMLGLDLYNNNFTANAMMSCMSTLDGSSEVAKLTIKNVMLHELAMTKENQSPNQQIAAYFAKYKRNESA